MRFRDFKALSLQCGPFFSFCQFLIMKLNNNKKIPFNRQSDIFIKNNELTSHKHHTYEQRIKPFR